MKIRLNELFKNSLYGIVSVEHGAGRSAVYQCEEMLKAGIKIIQYREKYRSKKIRYNECLELRKLCLDYNACFIVNDDIDIALAVKADGIHIGQDDLPIEEARNIVGPDMIIGLSSHSPEQGLDAVRRGADYIGVGPVYATKTKANVCDPVGLDYVSFVSNNISIPWVAIGGIKTHNIDQVISQGASCICLVTEIVAAKDIQKCVKKLQKKILT